jgi:hypothetical protein
LHLQRHFDWQESFLKYIKEDVCHLLRFRKVMVLSCTHWKRIIISLVSVIFDFAAVSPSTNGVCLLDTANHIPL